MKCKNCHNEISPLDKITTDCPEFQSSEPFYCKQCQAVHILIKGAAITPEDERCNKYFWENKTLIKKPNQP
jgi:hypothetical protein